MVALRLMGSMKFNSFVSRAFPSTLAAAAIAVVSIVCRSTLDAAQTTGALLLTIVYPSVGARIPDVKASFAFGAATPGSTVAVNGIVATMAPDGGWIAFVPFSPGRFVLHVKESLGASVTELDRTVIVDATAVFSFPSVITVVEPGDTLPLEVQAAAGDRVIASGPGFHDIALSLDPPLGLGAFSASIRAADEPGAPQAVTYRVTRPDGASTIVGSDATLQIEPHRVRIGEVVPYSPDPESGWRPYGMLAPAPGAPTAFTVPVGTPFQYGRRQGAYVAVELGPESGRMWIDAHQVAPDPAATGAPRELLPELDHVTRGTREDTYAFRFAVRAPFRIYEDVAKGELTIKVFDADGGGGDHDRVIDDLPRPLWGYTARWVGDDLEITVRRPPPFVAAPAPALRGLLVVIDPGHAPDSGAVGPLGTVERDVNLDIAGRLQAKLIATGARVVMTRDSDTGIALYDRPALAEKLDADVLISVHNNAWPDGVDPASHHGFTIYYFQPHSAALAEQIHAAYARDTDLPDEGLQVGDLALVRSTALPAVLTESAFISWPLEEMRLRDASFRDRLASTMADGMERWAEAMRDIENGRPGPSAASIERRRSTALR
jgi:N-acetylmuramoyl-L-alanine amidase